MHPTSNSNLVNVIYIYIYISNYLLAILIEACNKLLALYIIIT